MKMADEYFEESRRLYERPLVTRVYKHPDDLFDAHSYDKAACKLHMLRNDIGNNQFKKSINIYLNLYKNKTAETDHLREIVEDVSGKSIRQFFDQWFYRSGHPKLDIEFSFEPLDYSNKIKIKISQIQQQEGEKEKDNDDGISNTDYNEQDYYRDLFVFDLDIKIVFSIAGIGNDNNHLIETIPISRRITEHVVEISNNRRIEWISIDPQLKILKEVKSIKISKETNEFQLKIC